MTRYAFEDLTPGFSIALGPQRIARDEIVAFARVFDPQPFHLGEEEARGTFVGRLIASGWHTCALGMRLFTDDFVLHSTSMGSPGVDELRWSAPVLPDDALSGRLVVEEARPSRSKPDRGLVRMRMQVDNARGETVMTQAFWVMFGRRGVEPDPPSEVAVRRGREALSRSAPGLAGAGGQGDGTGTGTGAAFLEDLVPGAGADLGAYAFTPERVLDFARAYDPQPFHVDAEAGRRSHFGGLVASGWHTGAACMSRIVASFEADRAAARARGLPVAQSGPSPGFRDLRWIKPVYAGDTIRFRTTILDARPSASRPGWGLVTSRLEGWLEGENEAGGPVFSYVAAAFRQRRPG